MQPFEGRVHHGGNASETAAAAMQLRVQRKIVRGRMHFCSFPPLFFFSPPPSYNLDSYAIVHRDGHRDKLPYLRDSGWFLHESLIEEFEKRIRERERDIYITILIFFDFYEE